jgi:hypothetical protein
MRTHGREIGRLRLGFGATIALSLVGFELAANPLAHFLGCQWLRCQRDAGDGNEEVLAVSDRDGWA